MIRKEGVPKGLNDFFDPTDPSKMFRPATWEEALNIAAGMLKNILDRDGSQALAGFGSAKARTKRLIYFKS